MFLVRDQQLRAIEKRIQLAITERSAAITRAEDFLAPPIKEIIEAYTVRINANKRANEPISVIQDIPENHGNLYYLLISKVSAIILKAPGLFKN